VSKVERKYRRLRRWKKGKPVQGTYCNETIEVMRRLGWRVTDSGTFDFAKAPTVRAFCEDRAHMGPFIVRVPGHVFVISHGMIHDGYSVPWQNYRRLSRRVTGFWQFDGKTRMPADEKPKATKPPVDHVAVRAERARRALARLETRAKRIATAIKKRRRQVKYYEVRIGDAST